MIEKMILKMSKINYQHLKNNEQDFPIINNNKEQGLEQ